mmetsp:Transcript_3014/g.7025  ORF Transcript_3014/g.7025 Transcript_3014/m.7025 type:complete len:210 (-) Transcript_3014:652-1281(-)
MSAVAFLFLFISTTPIAARVARIPSRPLMSLTEMQMANHHSSLLQRDVGCTASHRGARTRLSNRQKRNIKHPENILRKETAESAQLGNRIGLDKARAMRAEFCSLCATIEGEMTFHHLIPRATHGKRWCLVRFTREERSSGVCLCRDCHDQVHKTIDERDLAMEYNTIESLQQHPHLRSYVDEKAPWTWLSAPKSKHRDDYGSQRERQA